MFIRVDKENITVAVNKSDYMCKVSELLSDRNTYENINKNPYKSLTDNLRTLLNRWKTNNFISDSMYKSLLPCNTNLPRAYGLPKIHKVELIVSLINTPLYKIAAFFHDLQYLKRAFQKLKIQ